MGTSFLFPSGNQASPDASARKVRRLRYLARMPNPAARGKGVQVNSDGRVGWPWNRVSPPSLDLAVFGSESPFLSQRPSGCPMSRLQDGAQEMVDLLHAFASGIGEPTLAEFLPEKQKQAYPERGGIGAGSPGRTSALLAKKVVEPDERHSMVDLEDRTRIGKLSPDEVDRAHRLRVQGEQPSPLTDSRSWEAQTRDQRALLHSPTVLLSVNGLCGTPEFIEGSPVRRFCLLQRRYETRRRDHGRLLDIEAEIGVEADGNIDKNAGE